MEETWKVSGWSDNSWGWNDNGYEDAANYIGVTNESHRKPIEKAHHTQHHATTAARTSSSIHKGTQQDKSRNFGKLLTTSTT